MIVSLIVLYFFIETSSANQPVERHCDMSGILYVLLIAHHFILALLSIPIFLNLKRKINQNYKYSFLSFFGLHILYYTSSFLFSKAGNEAPFMFFLMSIPFFIIYTLEFIRFRKKLSTPEFTTHENN